MPSTPMPICACSPKGGQSRLVRPTAVMAARTSLDNAVGDAEGRRTEPSLETTFVLIDGLCAISVRCSYRLLHERYLHGGCRVGDVSQGTGHRTQGTGQRISRELAHGACMCVSYRFLPRAVWRIYLVTEQLRGSGTCA